MGKRKFSFDIPRLKIGNTKADFKALRDHLSNDNKSALDDSPPPTPKSVRPPLSPQQDAELRAACTIVLQGWDAVPGQKGTVRDPAIAKLGAKPQLDYAAIKRTAPQEYQQLQQKSRSYNYSERKSPTQSNFSPDGYRHRPGLNSDELDHERQGNARQTAADARAEQLMGGAPLRPPPSAEAARDRSEAHMRSQSSPQTLASAASDAETLAHRPKITTRTGSVETASTTSPADTADDPISASTGITSAYITPARRSKRGSSQELDFECSSSLQTMDIVGGDWLTHGQEKHKQAQKEHGEKESQDGDALDSEDTITTKSGIPITVAKVPERKPVAPAPTRAPSNAVRRSNNRLQNQDPPRSASVHDTETETGRKDPKHSISDLLRSRSTKAPATPKYDRNTPPKRDWRDMHSLHGQEGGAKGIHRARSITRKLTDYVRPGSAQGERSESRPRSRSRSRTRQVMDYFRPQSVASERKASEDITRPSLQTNRSHDSQTSVASGAQKLQRTASQRWRAWRGPTRADRSASNPATDWLDSLDPKESERGRQEKQEEKRSESARPKAKPPVDLNRELPPLPGLDSWKNEAEDCPPTENKPEPPTPTVKVESPDNTAKNSSRKSRPKLARKHASAKEVEDILMARMGSPSQNRSNSSSVDESRAFCGANNPWQETPPLPSAPPPPPPPVHAGQSDSPGNQQVASKPSYQSAFVADQVQKHSRQRSKSLQNPLDTSLKGHQSSDLPSPFSPMSNEFTIHKFQPATTARAQIVRMPRYTGTSNGSSPPSAEPQPRSHGRKPSASISHVGGDPEGHSRNTSAQTSSTSYFQPSKRDSNPRTSPKRLSPDLGASGKTPTALNVKKWFPHRKSKENQQQKESWMDHVVRSGANSGTILLPHGAGHGGRHGGMNTSIAATGSPSVRY